VFKNVRRLRAAQRKAGNGSEIVGNVPQGVPAWARSHCQAADQGKLGGPRNRLFQKINRDTLAYPAAEHTFPVHSRKPMTFARHLLLFVVPFTLAAWCLPAARAADEPPKDKTTQELQAAAERGDAEALFQLGRIYWYGKQVPKDQKKAVEYYRQAAEKNHPDALAGLGSAYGLGQGVDQKDEQAAAGYFRRAAELGSAVGQMNLGTMLISGQSVEKNTEEGLRLATKAAEQGLLKAQVYLGELYLTGDAGVPRDYEKALLWFRKAVEQEDVRAMNAYGVMLRDGLGTERNPAAAASCFRRAADKGSLKGFLNVGSAYFYGNGVKLDKITGMSWWFAGEELGDGACRETAVRLTGGINAEDVSKARELGKKIAQERVSAVLKNRLKPVQ
jgi:TPR repeat protein